MTDYLVSQADDGRRLREVLRGSMRISFTAMKRAKWNGKILLNGTQAAVDRRVRAGDRIQVVFPEAVPAYDAVPFDLPLTVPYEDSFLMVVDKPAPLASQSSAGHPRQSLENAVYAYLGRPEGFVYRPVNRLDRGTSGLMVIAKDGHTQDLMQRQLHTEDFLREYLALTEGVPEPAEGVIDLPVAKENAASVKREVRSDGQPARTAYRVLEVRGSRALVRLKLFTGRTHQIRVHLSAIGCPVCGDFLYGTELPEEFPGRFALHSAYLTLVHPLTRQKIQLESLPSWIHAASSLSD